MAQIVFGSARELARLGAGSAAELAGAAHGRVVVVTDGAQGATAWVGGRSYRAAPSAPVRAVDTSGAGDALAAAFLDELLIGSPIDVCLNRGVAAGAATILHPGALPPLSSE